MPATINHDDVISSPGLLTLKDISLDDREFFSHYLQLAPHELAVYSFENIYMWKNLYRVSWDMIDDHLCVFFSDQQGSFLYLPPLAADVKPEVVAEVFDLLDSINPNKAVSRIEYVEEADLEWYHTLGYRSECFSHDYLYLTDQLARLQGNPYKAKRACVNYFTKHYAYEMLDYADEYREDCLALYQQWAAQRRESSDDPVYCGMLEDSFVTLQTVLDDYAQLDCCGKVVKVEGEVRAFTFGYRLSPDTMCVLFEITDLTVKGLAQFIFREFSAELSAYRYINAMDTLGMENLDAVKLSYRPVRLAQAYQVQRQGISL
jgi:hypothetical protein